MKSFVSRSRLARIRKSVLIAAGLTLVLASQALAAPVKEAKAVPQLAVTASDYRSAVYSTDGKVWYWGGIADVIDGKHTFRDNVPAAMLDLKDIVDIQSLQHREIFLKKDGTVWEWGAEYRLNSADITDGTTEFPAPKPIEGLSRIAKISASGIGSAIDENGGVWIWHPDRYDKGPRKLENINDAKELSANNLGDVLILRKNGTVWKWTGYSERNANENYKAERVGALKDVVALSTGHGRQFFAIKKDGTVWGWGENYGGKLGLPITTEIVEKPVQLKNLNDVSSIVTGYLRTMVIKKDGTLWVMGYDVGSTTNLANKNGPELRRIDGLKKVASVALGYEHAVAVTEDGKVWAWGGNAAGQLGDGTFKNSGKPIQVRGIR